MKIKDMKELLYKEHYDVSKSYLSLRRLIGIMGIMLPLINIFGGWFISHTPVLDTISNYYYTNMRDFFVGLLWAISLFLITYKGYNKLDQIVTSVTGVSGLGVAMFPCSNRQFLLSKVGLFQLSINLSNIIHVICAAIFLTLLASISLFLFTKTEVEKEITKQKRLRNTVYIICGVVILACLFAIVLCDRLMTPEIKEEYRVILIFEALSLLSFGISWLIKGETLLKDKLQQPTKMTTPDTSR